MRFRTFTQFIKENISTDLSLLDTIENKETADILKKHVARIPDTFVVPVKDVEYYPVGNYNQCENNAFTYVKERLPKLDTKEVYSQEWLDAIPNFLKKEYTQDKLDARYEEYVEKFGKVRYYVALGFVLERDFPVEHWFVYDDVEKHFVDVTPLRSKHDCKMYIGTIIWDSARIVKEANRWFDADDLKNHPILRPKAK